MTVVNVIRCNDNAILTCSNEAMMGSELNKSYFVDTDLKYGCGNISHFTYLSEFNRSWKGLAYIEAAIATTLFVLSTVGNVLILGCIYKNRGTTTITNCFVANLALADILFVSSAPFVAYIRIVENWSFGQAMCKIVCCEMLICGYVMLWTMAAISIDRYICINLTPAKRMNRSHVKITCAGIWIFAAVLMSPLLAFFYVKKVKTQSGTVTFCTVLWPKAYDNFSIIFVALLTLTAFGLPLLATVINYSRILRKFWKSKRAVEQSVAVPPRGSMSGMSRHKRNMQIVKTLIILVALFVVMWSPIFLTFPLIQYDLANRNNNISSSVLIWAIVVAYLNACINPFLYGVINVDVRRSCLFCYRSPHSSDASHGVAVVSQVGM